MVFLAPSYLEVICHLSDCQFREASFDLCQVGRGKFLGVITSQADRFRKGDKVKLTCIEIQLKGAVEASQQDAEPLCEIEGGECLFFPKVMW